MKLRKLELRDAESMLEWMHSKNVVEMLAQNFEDKTIEDCKRFIRNANKDESTFLHRAICNDEDEYLGTVSLKHINMQDRNAEYAISMREKAMGTGASLYGTKEILKYAFHELHLEKVYLNVITENVRAKKFYVKAGFRYEGVAKKHIMIQGDLHDLEWYAFFKDME